MSELLRLADLCEKATAGNRLLDARIFECLGLTPTQERHCKDWCSQNGRTDLTRAMYIEAWAPHYTGSIDAAMTLVPADAWVTIDRYSISDNPEHQQSNWRVWIKKLAGGLEGDGPCGLLKHFAKGRTPALALCTASLRAADTAGVR